jgi:hypothetical protein
MRVAGGTAVPCGRFAIFATRCVAVLSCLVTPPGTAATDAGAEAAPAVEPAPASGHPKAPDVHCVHEKSMWSHALSASYDRGRASAYGLGYQVGRLHTVDAYPDVFMLTRVGVGFDVAAVTADHSGLDAMTYSLAARTALVGGPGGLGLELRGGVADARAGDSLGFMAAGAFYSFYVFELGYSYQFPLAKSRPHWLSAHQFSLRIHVPVWRHGLVAGDHCD